MQRLSKLLTVATLALATFAFAKIALAADLYVATNGTGDGSSWANATNSLQGAIDAISGAFTTNMVWVSNGVYEASGVTNYPAGTLLTNRVAIWKAITVRSANNDPANTIIRGAWASDGNTNGVDAVRCVWMTNKSVLIGFTLTNGATLATGTDDTYGGGVLSQGSSVMISNCVISGNAAFNNGGGVYGDGILFNDTLSGNQAKRGGALQSINGTAVLSNCVIVGNFASLYAGGTRMAILYNCSLISNSTPGYGGATDACTMYNCLLSGNWAGSTGGAIQGGWGGNLYNCTIVSNYAVGSGGGVYADGAGTRKYNYYNCIIYHNASATANSNWAHANDTITFTNCCTAPAKADWPPGNITSEPMFVNKDSGNWRLQAKSPCVNTGTNGSWITTSYPYDLDSHIRIRYGTVDMGAYERVYEGAIFGFH
ncbi:MAG: hypothetical protein ABIH24_04505 [Verrucomicrobiota bacterium]